LLPTEKKAIFFPGRILRFSGLGPFPAIEKRLLRRKTKARKKFISSVFESTKSNIALHLALPEIRIRFAIPEEPG
jgi:hypothetical protein